MLLLLFMPYNKNILKGVYTPKNPSKYKGDPTNIIYRSSWELKFMNYCDNNAVVLEWGSEELFIPYISPVDNKRHRYFPDFYIKVKEKSGKIQKYLVEVKPQYQVNGPVPQKRMTKRYLNEVMTYAVNQAKWKYAREYCEDRLIEFKIITEEELGIK